MATSYPSDTSFGSVWSPPKGILGQLKTVQNGPIGMRFIGTALLFFVLGGINALLLRLQLIRPENDFLSPELYNQLFTMHGSTMMFLFAIPLLEGIGALVLPQMLGGRELPFPRLSAFAYWTFLFGGLLFYGSFLIGAVPDGGWFAYVPLTGPEFRPGIAIDFWLLGLNVAEIGAIAGAMELIIAVLKVRAPGMALHRIPVFAWAMLVTGWSMIFAFTPLIVGSTLLELDRKLGTDFYNPKAGGDPLLWQHLFWIFGHPDVYIQFLPAVGMVSMIVPVFARSRLTGYTFVMFSIMTTGFISFGLWVHHMFTVGLPQISLTLFTAASMVIAIPSGIQVFSWLATIWSGRIVWRAPFLFVVGFLVIFVAGGLTGVMVAAVPFDWQVHDSYFVVAHFHYVLIGGVVFPIFAGIYYWAPKFTGRMLDERLGRWNFWLMFIGFNVAFFPMHIAGLLGMPRRVYTYDVGLGWDIYNLIATVGAFILAAGIAVFFWNFAWSMVRGERAPDNPWGADSLEWATTSPPPNYGFRTLPIVRSRHPLWDQARLDEGDESTVKLVRALADWPRDYRAQLVTTTTDAVPQEVFRVAGPSYWPIVLSFALTVETVALIYDLYLLGGAALVVCIVALVGWHWPDSLSLAEPGEQELHFEREHQIPINREGSHEIARWGMYLSIITVAIVLGTLIFCYFFLRLGATQWPPAQMAHPSLLLPSLALGALVLSSVPLAWGVGGIRDDRRGRLMSGLGLALLLGSGGLVAQVLALGEPNFDMSTHAYGSIFFVLGGYQILVVVAGLMMGLLALFWAWKGRYSRRSHQGVANTALFWYFAVVSEALVYATIYLSPYVI